MNLMSTSQKSTMLESLMSVHLKNLKTLKFSTFVYNENPRMNPVFPTREVLLVYRDLERVIESKIKPHFGHELHFVKTGLQRIPEPEKQPVMNLTPQVAHQLRIILEAYDLPAPDWLPEVFKTESIDGQHSFTFLYDWSTVQPKCIGYNDVYTFTEMMESYARSPQALKAGIAPLVYRTTRHAPTLTSSEQAIASSNVTPLVQSVKPAQNKTAEPTERRAGTPYSSADAQHVEHNLYVAKKYISLHQSAASRNLAFNLSLDDVDTLLKTPRCHYTDVDLVAFPHDGKDAELPDNYLTVDRVDNNQGYVRGNVVACAMNINKLKDQMSAEEFQKAITLKQMLKHMNLSEQQLSLLGVLA